jgi:hypothetical protein
MFLKYGGTMGAIDDLVRSIPIKEYLILSVTYQYGVTLAVKVMYCDFVHSFLNLRVYGISGVIDGIVYGGIILQ